MSSRNRPPGPTTTSTIAASGVDVVDRAPTLAAQRLEDLRGRALTLGAFAVVLDVRRRLVTNPAVDREHRAAEHAGDELKLRRRAGQHVDQRQHEERHGEPAHTREHPTPPGPQPLLVALLLVGAGAASIASHHRASQAHAAAVASPLTGVRDRNRAGSRGT